MEEARFERANYIEIWFTVKRIWPLCYSSLENIRHIIPLKGAAPVPPSAKPGGVRRWGVIAVCCYYVSNHHSSFAARLYSNGWAANRSRTWTYNHQIKSLQLYRLSYAVILPRPVAASKAFLSKFKLGAVPPLQWAAIALPDFSWGVRCQRSINLLTLDLLQPTYVIVLVDL